MELPSWKAALDATPDARVRASLEILYDGHRRFLDGRPEAKAYTADDFGGFAQGQRPKVAIVACSDSRVAPEVVFDQPLGSIFASRVPGNVASDGAKWMVDLAVSELKVPLVMVIGHTGCFAVGQVVAGHTGSGGQLGRDIEKAVSRARMGFPQDLGRAAVEENVRFTVERLKSESADVRRALEQDGATLIGAVYDMGTGQVHLLA